LPWSRHHRLGRGRRHLPFRVLQPWHASTFVVPGVRRISSANLAGTIETVAVRSPDDSIAVIALNAGSAAKTFHDPLEQPILQLHAPGRCSSELQVGCAADPAIRSSRRRVHQHARNEVDRVSSTRGGDDVVGRGGGST
jgi:hypothetical protein